MNIVTVDFQSYENSIPNALDAIAAHEQIARQSKILIKPNLINSSPHPITTAPATCEAIIKYIRRHCSAEIVIAEGCGDVNLDTDEVFRRLGYVELAEQYGIPLIDLNHAELQTVQNPDCPVFPEMHLPEIAFTHYIISVPVLKVHSLAGVTGTLKNMMGFAPPKYYSGKYGIWKKAVFHGQIQESIIDLNTYIAPHLSIMDCSIGMAEFHMGGPHCDPPVNKIIAGYNPWEVDKEAAAMLGVNWRDIKHIAVGCAA